MVGECSEDCSPLAQTGQYHSISEIIQTTGSIISLEEQQSLHHWIEDNDDDIHVNTSSRHEIDHDRVGRW